MKREKKAVLTNERTNDRFLSFPFLPLGRHFADMRRNVNDETASCLNEWGNENVKTIPISFRPIPFHSPPLFRAR